MDASTLTRPRLPLPRRLLAALTDERLAAEAKRGNAVAFEVIYERHHRGLLSFCRHMLRSQEDGEDALQQTFASAFRALPGSTQPVALKPWLYSIARNRCLTMLRARREYPSDQPEIGGSTAGLSEEVEQREELRQLLANVEDLPEDQRAALVLSEIGDLSHAEIAPVLGCETQQVRALVFRARSALIQDRRAREIPCADIREQLATASAGELRRGHLRRHVRNCSGCAEFKDDVRRQRGLLAIALPVIPSLGLRESALAAAGIGGGGAAGGGGLMAALGASGAAKVATVAIATGGAVGGVAATDPDLVARAEAAVGHVANQMGIATPSSTGSPDSISGTEKASELSDWEGVPAAAQRQTKPEGKTDRRTPGDGAAARDQGRDGAGEGGRGQGHAYGRTNERSSPDVVRRGQGGRGAYARGNSNGSSPGKGGGGATRGGPGFRVPRNGTDGGDKPAGSLPRRDRLRKPADELVERGKRSARGFERDAGARGR